jgi:Outer membrane efflux protein
MQVIPRAIGSAHERVRSRKLGNWPFAALAVLLVTAGCTRAYYHDYADSDVYGILKERLFDWRWRVPERPVEAPPNSRMADLNDPNHQPLITDEVAARRFQVSSRFPFEYHGWKKRGATPIEDLSWQPYVPLESDGKVLLSKDAIMRIAMMNSREYQFAFENVYLSALSLTLARFQFMVQGYSNWGIFYSPLTGGGVPVNTPTTTYGTIASPGTVGTPAAATPAPATPNLNNQLQLAAANGFLLNLMSGGQLLVNLANSIVFEYSNKGVQMVSPNLTVSFVQPLLRGAWARIVTQGLSLQERAVLYNLRSFAEFRRQFYVSLVTGSGGAQYSSATGYLALLFQLQSIRNLEYNLKSARQNLTIYEAEFPRSKSALEVSQIAFTYQNTQAALLSAQAGLMTLLDGFKINLGLPTEVEVRIDDSPLDQFELNDERLDAMRARTDALLLQLVQSDALPVAQLARHARSLRQMYDELETIHDEVVAESERWQKKLDATHKQGFEGPEGVHKKEIFDRESALSLKLKQTLAEVNQDIDKAQDNVATFLARLGVIPVGPEFGGTIPGFDAPLVRGRDTTPIKDATQKLRDLASKEFRALFSTVSVTQTRVRVFLIELPAIDLTINQSIQIALGNRLDLQNALANVTDAWRTVEVDANQLQGFLNFIYNGNFSESPNHNGLFHFDAGNNIQTFGLQFDAPINRRAERNQYRADQIQYQRARRFYMQTRDQIVQQIRLDMRNVVLLGRTFEINREQILSAAAQLESAEEDVRVPLDANSSSTLNLLTALTNVLSARNQLISTWVSYETVRMSLYRDFDLMDIDANGVWTNENDPTAIDIALRHAESAPAFSLTIPARISDLSPGVASDSTFYIDVEPGGKPNKPPDAATDPIEDEQPDILIGPGGSGALPARPGDARPAGPPAVPSPFAPPRPGP